jgi:hypothetical protein
MAAIDGLILMQININHPLTTVINISKAQPPKAKGLGGVGLKNQNAGYFIIQITE